MRSLRVALAGLLVGGACWISPSSVVAAPENPVAEARREVNTAKTELGKLLRVVNSKKGKAQTELKKNPEYKAAVLARNSLTIELRAVSGPVLAAVRKGGEYKALRMKRVKLASEVTALRRAGEAEQAATLAEELASVDAELKELDNQALLADSKTSPIKAKLNEAEEQIAALEGAMQAELDSDSEYSGAQSQLEEAKTRLATAEEALKSTSREAAAARREARATALAAARERTKGRIVSTGSS